jgi:hypothetical protein
VGIGSASGVVPLEDLLDMIDSLVWMLANQTLALSRYSPSLQRKARRTMKVQLRLFDTCFAGAISIRLLEMRSNLAELQIPLQSNWDQEIPA